MRKLLFGMLISLPLLITSIYPAQAATYTSADVAKHNTLSDCWMIFENKVYDFTTFHLNDHADRFMDITSWCGKDMTEDFKTKAGEGKDHKSRTYSDLANYYIGDLVAVSPAVNSTTDSATPTDSVATTDTTTNATSITTPKDTSARKVENPYNFWAPALISFFGYTIYWGTTKVGALKKYKLFNKHTFNLTFNTVLLLGLIPSAGFGIFMIARYSIDDLKEIDFDFMYWHVELSIALSVLMAGHFLTRFKLYKAPLNLFRRRKVISPSAV